MKKWIIRKNKFGVSISEIYITEIAKLFVKPEEKLMTQLLSHFSELDASLCAQEQSLAHY